MATAKRLKKKNPEKEQLPTNAMLLIAICSFIVGLLLSFMVAYYKINLVDIQAIWEIFTPIIALVLGYLMKASNANRS